MMSNNCLIYCRVSDPRQVSDGAGLETQEEILRDYATRNGFNVVKIFIEPGESAKTTRRPELRRMHEYVRKHYRMIDVLLIYKFNRLARHSEDHHSLRRFFRDHGIRIISACERVDDTPAGHFQENVLAAVSQFDNEDRAETCRNGMVRAVKDGRWVWLAPVGYQNARVNGRPNLAPDQSTAAPVLRTFQLLASGHHPESVRQQMTREGLRARSGAALSRSQFYNLIRNPVYAGTIDAFGLHVEGSFQAIVPSALFQRVQSLLDGRQRATPSRYRKCHPDFPLRGLLICGHCGRRMTGSWSRGNGGRYANYRCPSCRGRGTGRSRERVHAEFKQLLASYSILPALVEPLKAAIAAALERRQSAAVSRRKEVARELEKAQQERKLLILKDLRGEYGDSALVREILADFDRRIGELEYEREELSSLPRADDVTEWGVSLLANLGGYWESATPDLKQRFQKLVFPEGLVYNRDGTFGTKTASLLLTTKTALSGRLSRVVDHTDSRWNRALDELRQLYRLLRNDEDSELARE